MTSGPIRGFGVPMTSHGPPPDRPGPQVSQELVDAYLARRALDHLVGFNLSPVLWRKLPGAKSAGAGCGVRAAGCGLRAAGCRVQGAARQCAWQAVV